MLYEETNVPDKSADLPEINNYDIDDDHHQTTVLKDLQDTENKIELKEEEDHAEEPEKLNQNNTVNNAVLSEAGIIIRKVNAKWNNTASEYTLDNLNLHVQPGTLVVVAGPVGAGKSRYV